MRYAARLSALCSRYAGGPAEGMDLMHDTMEGMDLMHDTMFKVFDTIGKYRYRGEGSLYAWISRMAVHLAIDRLRKEKKLEVSPLDDRLPEVKAPEPADIDRIPASVLNGFIAELPAVKRVIFNMACVEDLPHKEIASRRSSG